MDEVKITGLEQTAYFINNDIWVEIVSTNDNAVELCDVFLYSIQKNVLYKNVRLYAYKGKIRFNLSLMIKGYFNNPEHDTDYSSLGEIVAKSNWDKFKLDFVIQKTELEIKISLEKMFVRGGVRTTKTNISVPQSQPLRPVYKIPFWEGYPVAEYVLRGNGIKKINKILIPKESFDKQISSVCSPVYVKFLNSLGGYSYWLFSKQTHTQSNKSVGVLTNNGQIKDLGNMADFEIELQSKVTAYYMPIMYDLIISPEIYIYSKDTEEWERISSNDNQLQFNNFSKGDTIKLNFKKHYNFKPQTTW